MWAEPKDRPSSTAVIYLMVGLLWMLPISQELTRRVPSIPFRLWPLGRRQKAAIYIANLLLNPLIAIAILFAALSRDPGVGVALFWTGLAGPFLVLGSHRLVWSPFESIPRLPGKLGGLMQSYLRELLQLLDFYLALLTAIGGLIFCRLSAHPDSEAAIVLGVIVVLIMSTCAQGHTSFDAVASDQRIRMLPISRIAVLFARDVAWLLVTVPLVIGFRPLACVGAALAALAVGHRISAGKSIEQRRWNFATGKLVPEGIFQMLVTVSAGAAVYNQGLPAFFLVLVGYAGSLLWFGR